MIISGDSLLSTPLGDMSIKEIYDRMSFGSKTEFPIYVFDKINKIYKYIKLIHISNMGYVNMSSIELDNGKSITCNLDNTKIFLSNHSSIPTKNLSKHVLLLTEPKVDEPKVIDKKKSDSLIRGYDLIVEDKFNHVPMVNGVFVI